MASDTQHLPKNLVVSDALRLVFRLWCENRPHSTPRPACIPAPMLNSQFAATPQLNVYIYVPTWHLYAMDFAILTRGDTLLRCENVSCCSVLQHQTGVLLEMMPTSSARDKAKKRPDGG